MKKVRGKALALVLSLALVVSSFSTVLASARTRTVNGTLDGNDEDAFYLVNGGKDDDLVLKGFGTKVAKNPTLETSNHEQAEDVHIAAITRKSGDNLVKWYDEGDDNDSIDDDTEDADIALELRSASVSGTEVPSLLYKGTYTDDDDNEYTVRGTQDVTVRVYDKGEVVLGENETAGKAVGNTGVKGELDDSFAQKTVSHETADGATDSKNLVALKATNDASNPILVKWVALPTTADGKNPAASDDYVLTRSGNNIDLVDGEKANATASFTQSTADETKPGLKLSENKAYIEVTPPQTTTKTTTLSMEKVAATATAPGLELKDGKVVVTPVTDTTKDYTYVYTTDGKDPTADSEAVPDGGIPVTAAGSVKVAAVSESAIVSDSTATGTVTTVDTADVGTPVGTVATIDVDGTDVTVENTNGTTPVAGVTLTYSVVDAEGTAKVTDEEVKDNKIPASELANGDEVTVSAHKSDAALGTATGTYAVTDGAAENYVVATVADKANPSSFTFTLETTDKFEDTQKALADDSEDKVASLSDVKQKASITKTILVDDANFRQIGKEKGNTYLHNGTIDGDDTDRVKVNGFEVKFDKDTFNAGAVVTVEDKASVEKISGSVQSVSVDEDASVDEIATDDSVAPTVNVGEGKVDKIDFDGDAKGTVNVNTDESVVGDIDDVQNVTVDNGKVGNIDASGKVEIKPDDDEAETTVGNVTADLIEIDSGDSKGVKAGTLKATSDDSEFTLSGDNVTVDGINFDNYGAELKLDGFDGTIPAPKNAAEEDATVSTQQADDKVTVKGDADIDVLTIADESQVTFDSKANIGSVDGSGKLVVGLGKLNVKSDASDVQLKISDPFKVGDVAYTSDHDTIDTDSFDNYGFTVTKTEGSDKDTFKIKSLEFTGLTITPATADIAKGYSQTFTASAYAPGSAIPEGYKAQFFFDGDDSIFDYKDNADGTITITAKDISDFSSENKATLTAELVDEDGATNDDYDAGEADITAVETPAKNFKSDTTGYVPLKVGQTYQFKITSLDGKAPTSFSVASNGATIQFAGATGSDYFYKVTGAKEGSYGVYVNGGGDEHRAAILVIKGVNVTTDTTAVTKAPGQTYQFKITAPSQPSFGAVGLKSVLASKSGNNYFYKVTASNVKGGHGIYVNGVRVAIFTVA